MDIEKILSQMTLEDKIALCSGKNFWQTKDFDKYGIPSLFMCDGPLGLRKQESTTDMLGINNSRPSTCFPAEVTTASAWDPELLEKLGNAYGEEAHDQNVDIVLGPGANIKRNPLCGRNFEYFSEDPFLAGKLAAGFIRGAEAQGIGTSLKHFAANSQEESRFTSDSVMDERTLREIYLTAFEIAVKEGRPSTVMCAYPKLNGIHCSDHKQLLDDILRKEWGFEGIVMTDWGAMNDRLEGFRAGCDLNMPGGSSYMEKEAAAAVRAGTLSEECVNACARRMLKLIAHAAQKQKPALPCDYNAHNTLAREAAEQGAVLLKNEDSILPLKEGSRVAVIGAMAKSMRYQGAGSSHINPTRLSQPLDFLKGAAFTVGCDESGNTTDALLAEAASAATKAEVAVVFAGLPDSYESEGFDRDSMKMPEGHLSMIKAVAAANPNTVVVLLCGSAVECPWADSVKGILYMGLPGQAGGEAIANLLYGRACPGGRLAESWPFRYDDVPSSEIYCKTKDALYEEGIYVGYRYYDKAGVKVRWPFGYGLSYTTFEYSDLAVNGKSVSVRITNTGSTAGYEVAQLYVCTPQNGLHRPVRELKGFKKIFLKPGDNETVTFELDERAFALWNGGWKVPGGTYTVSIGSLEADISISGKVIPAPAWQEGSFYESCKGKPQKDEWEKLLGRSYAPTVAKKGSFGPDSTIEEMKDHSLVMKLMYVSTKKVIARSMGGKKDENDPNFRMIMKASVGGPIRSMIISGGLKDGIMHGLLEMANGHFLKGLIRLIRG